MAITKEQAIDILDKFDFFQGQRAGRELWNDKPFEVQEQDIKDFSNDVALLKEYISDVVPKSEVERLQKYNTDVAFKHYNGGRKAAIVEIFQDIAREMASLPPLCAFRLINGRSIGKSFELGREKAVSDVLKILAELEKKYMGWG